MVSVTKKNADLMNCLLTIPFEGDINSFEGLPYQNLSSSSKKGFYNLFFVFDIATHSYNYLIMRRKYLIE